VKDHYATLGVSRTATAEEIKKAYRKLASQHHPDKGGDTKKFQEIQAAYDVLGNAQTRSEYDNPQQKININFGNGNFADIFSMFNQAGFGAQQQRGHVRLTLWISMIDVALGGTRTVSLNSHQGIQAVEINIPQAIEDGAHVQYPKLGPGGCDLVITFRVQPSAEWHRSGLDLVTQKMVSIWDMICGGEVRIQDIYGAELQAKVPKGCQPGTRLRLKHRGLKTRQGQQGDCFVIIQPMIPSEISPEIVKAIEQYRT
jgi:molecular chaperone DnaJ